MKLLVLFFILHWTSFMSMAQELDFTSISETDYPVSEFDPSSTEIVHVDAFDISSLITWKQYKFFLSETTKIKGGSVSKKYTPKLAKDHLEACLNSDKFDKYPVVGVSWTAAREYCRWRTVIDNVNLIEFTYDLPKRSEWLTAIYQLDRKKKKHDLNSSYADWTLTTKDESMFLPANSYKLFLDFQFDATSNDPPALKRKIAIGASFNFSFSEFINYNQSYYQDSSYNHIGFRLVKHLVERVDIECYDDWLSEHLVSYALYSNWFNQNECIIGSTDVKFSLKSNRLMGKYVSNYSNGNKKVEGVYYKNQRVGKWIVWDSLGNKIIERIYTNSLHYQQIYPQIKDPQAEFFRSIRTEPYIHDEDNNLNYTWIAERSVTWSQRLWTRMTPEGNPTIFKNDRLIQLISLAAADGKIRIYDPAVDFFKDTITFTQFMKNRAGKVVAFDFKEDFFMDLDRGIADVRPIGICPLIETIVDGDTILQPVAWFYFPEIRSLLAGSFYRNRCLESHFFSRGNMTGFWKHSESDRTLADLFFMRDFMWNTTHHASIRGKYPIDSDEGGWKFRIGQIEREHDFWIYLSGN